MQPSDIVVSGADGTHDSLSSSLQALVQWKGVRIVCDDIEAVLGLSLRTVAVRRRVCLAAWMSHGCDAMLPQSCDLLGIRIRALHPPEAAVGLSGYSPFAQHFDASYAPLIRRALDHGQPVLAWRGWPGNSADSWGIITAEGGRGLGFVGVVEQSPRDSVPVVTPPVQLYVVEDVAPRIPDTNAALTAMTSAHVGFTERRGLADPDVVTGDGAYAAWVRRLQAASMCAVCGDHGWRCHVRHARRVSAARESAVRFLTASPGRAFENTRGAIDRLIGACRGVMDALNASRDEAAVEALSKSFEGKAALAAGVRAAQAADAVVARTAHELTIRATSNEKK